MERTGDFGPNWDESGARMYDPQLGRFHGVDLLAGMFPGITPVQFGANSPVVLNGPGGLCPDCKTWGDVLRAIHESTAAAGVYIKNGDGSSYTRSGAKLIGGNGDIQRRCLPR